MPCSVDIIIVNWNAGAQLRDCLESIPLALQSDIVIRRVVVVDNGSTDQSLDHLERTDVPLALIRNHENRGFAAACNQGAVGSQADYLLFLNPDTRLLPQSLGPPCALMARPEGSSIGIVGIQLVDASGRVARSCARFPTVSRFVSRMLGLDRAFPRIFPPHFMVEWDHARSREVDQVMGAFFLIRRTLFESLGGFDERFFVYFEEVDLSLRARVRGWKTFYLAESSAFHRGGGVTDQVKAARLFYSLRSRLLYGYKHFGRVAAHVLTLTTLTVEPVSRLLAALMKGSPRQLLETVDAYRRLWLEMPALVTRRPRIQAG